MAADTRVLICGGREFNRPDAMHSALMMMHIRYGFDVIIEGESPGADAMARDWAQLHGIEVWPFYADWELFGDRAGSLRNSKMLRDARPTLGVAFPGGVGTHDMIGKLVRAKVPTFVGTWGASTQPIIWEMTKPAVAK